MASDGEAGPRPLAVISGAAGGIGRGLAEGFLAAGYSVVGLDRAEGWTASGFRP
jgi:NAD(P)-dependent dehydrogenase (short-subunit alcohol dehydrogenase family)